MGVMGQLRSVGQPVILLAAIWMITGCTEQPSPAPPPSPASPNASSVDLLRRPWAYPSVAPGECPVMVTLQQPDPGLGPLLGDGPARAAGIGAGSVLTYEAPTDRADWRDRTWGGQKVLWAVDPTVQGPVLIRGRRLDAPGELAFEDPAQPELVLNTTPYEGQIGGWRDYPSYTRLRAPGCYAYQVDTSQGTWSILVIAKGPTL